jgi:hypothetical protein
MLFRALILPLLASVAVSGAADHWAYTPPVDSKPPGDGSAHPIDAFLSEARAKGGVKPAKMASPRQWVERAAFTLTGLPASKEQIERIEKSPDDETWKAIIEELLASPAYGERWARHWMDVARYADTQGYNFDKDNRYPFAYTYRDWLIKSFNNDLPYAQFVKLQVAADLMVDKPDHPDLAALGFLTVGPRAGQIEMLDDRVDVVTRGFLSSTVSCARCHDHKTDPISTQDFYSLYSIFENASEPGEKPAIGQPSDEAAYQEFIAKEKELKDKDVAARQAVIDQINNPESSAVYLELAWLANQEKWDTGKTSGETFKRGRYRLKIVERWKDFFSKTAWNDKPAARLAQWHQEMLKADDAGRKALCLALANEWSQATEGDLATFRKDERTPLSYNLNRVHALMDQRDDDDRRQRDSAMTKLQIEHPGATPRAMVVSDKPKWSDARVYIRGNPGNRSEPFKRSWLSFLGGGEFPEGKSARLSLAEKIADPANPMTSRVMVNRIWGWHFGQALTDPADFGPQQPVPVLRNLLDWLALRFNEKGGSVKEMHRLLLTSQAFRLAAEGPQENNTIDEANTLFWKWSRQRLDFESMRDRLLASSGALDTSKTGGRSVALDSDRADSRRSVYAFVDRYALPGTFVSFDLPHPDHHAPKRSETTVPQQALYFLNGPLVTRQAEKMVRSADFNALTSDADRVRWVYNRVFGRNPSIAEINDALDWIGSTDPKDYQPRVSGAWEIRHTPDTGLPFGELLPFPIYHEKMWKTGQDLAKAPIRYLSAGPDGGHPSKGHVLVLRFRATAPGQVKMHGTLGRGWKADQGAPLVYQVIANNSEVIGEGQLRPATSGQKFAAKWMDVKIGDTIDFAYRAPDGEHFGSTTWDIRVNGRDNANEPEREISSLKRNFPTSTSPPPVVTPDSPWADLVQMLWSSNEFHFID